MGSPVDDRLPRTKELRIGRASVVPAVAPAVDECSAIAVVCTAVLDRAEIAVGVADIVLRAIGRQRAPVVLIPGSPVRHGSPSTVARVSSNGRRIYWVPEPLER